MAARVLDQLSVTAWLPAALLMADVYLVVALFLVRKPHGRPSAGNLEQVVAGLNAKPVGVVLAVAFGLVIATLLTQSLEFAAVRFLEGYWGVSTAAALPTRVGTAIQFWRQRLLLRRAARLEHRAFVVAAPAVQASLCTDELLARAVDSIGRGWTPPLSVELVQRAEKYRSENSWKEFVPAHLRNRLLAIDARLLAFPDPSRMLPTRLGNTMRVAEDALMGDVAGSRMRGYIMRHAAQIDEVLLEQLDTYRNRLDMYAVMAPLCVALAVLDAICLPLTITPAPAVGFTAGLLVLAWFSYRGAVSAAVDHGEALLAIDTDLQRGGRRPTW